MSNYTHDYTAEYLSLFKKSGLKIQISDAAVLEKIGAAPASHIDVHASDTDYGHVMASSSLPAALGTAAVGTSLKYARADHVHPLPANVDAETAKALKNPFMLYLEGAAVAEDRVDGVTDVHLRILKLDAQALEGLINLDNLPIGTESGTIAAGNHTHDYSGVYAALLHEHTHLDITDWDTELSSALSGYATVHDHPYLPLKGGAMESDCALCTDILENRGWYFGLVNNSNTYDFSSGGHVTINTKIGASDNSTSLGDYCIHVRGYLTSNSSKTIDLYVYLSNTSSNQKTVDLVTAYGYRNYGSVTPSDVKIYKRNTTSGDGIKIFFTIPTNDRGTFAMNVDFISHDLSKANITNINSTNASDNKLLHGWTIGNTIIPSGTYETCNSLSIHTHAELSAGDGLKYASTGQTYNGGEARELSVDVDDNFNWTGVHSFPATIKINKAGVLIGKGSSSAIDAKAGSADKQFLKYSVSNNVGSYGFSAIGISDITGLQTALDGLVHSHQYLPLAGGVMNDGSAVSLDITEQHGNYYGLAYGSVTVSTSISEGSTEGRLLIETPIPANTSSGIDFLPPSNGGEQYYQIHITGLDTTNKGKTIDIKIGLGLKASPQGNLNASNSGWSSYGTIMPSSITHGVKGNRHAFVIVLPKGSYKLNIDGLFDFGVSRGANFLTEFQSKCIALRGDGGWCLIPDSTSGVTLDNSAMTQYALPMYSHAHAALSAGSGLKYDSDGKTYTGTDARTLSVDVGTNFSWTGTHTFSTAPKLKISGILTCAGTSSTAASINKVDCSTNGYVLKYNNGYTFGPITKGMLPGDYHYREHTYLTLLSTNSSSSTATFTHNAGTDQTVYLIIHENTSNTDFYVRIPSPSTNYAGDQIKFVIVNAHTSDTPYEPIIHFVKTDTSNDLVIGEQQGTSGISASQLRISTGEMLILNDISTTAEIPTINMWRAQKISETGF